MWHLKTVQAHLLKVLMHITISVTYTLTNPIRWYGRKKCKHWKQAVLHFNLIHHWVHASKVKPLKSVSSCLLPGGCEARHKVQKDACEDQWTGPLKWRTQTKNQHGKIVLWVLLCLFSCLLKRDPDLILQRKINKMRPRYHGREQVGSPSYTSVCVSCPCPCFLSSLVFHLIVWGVFTTQIYLF